MTNDDSFFVCFPPSIRMACMGQRRASVSFVKFVFTFVHFFSVVSAFSVVFFVVFVFFALPP